MLTAYCLILAWEWPDSLTLEDGVIPGEAQIKLSLLAMLERFAAEHYRRWAEQEADPSRKQGFLACAAREEFIAETVEGLDPNAQRIAQSLRERFPEIR